MLETASSCVNGQAKLTDELLGWTSDTLSTLTTAFNAPLTTEVKQADTAIKQHAVSILLQRVAESVS